MHDLPEVEQRIKDFIEEVSAGRLKASALSSEQSLIGDLDLDSLDYAQVFLGSEEWLGSKVPEDTVDWSKIRTIHELASLLHRNQTI